MKELDAALIKLEQLGKQLVASFGEDQSVNPESVLSAIWSFVISYSDAVTENERQVSQTLYIEETIKYAYSFCIKIKSKSTDKKKKRRKKEKKNAISFFLAFRNSKFILFVCLEGIRD